MSLAPEDVRGGRARRRRRTVTVTAGMTAVVFGLFVLTMMVGSYRLNPWEVLSTVLHLDEDPSLQFIVLDLRLPNAATALAVGMAMGMSGIVFQKLLANPLASPDFVGVSSGAGLFAVGSIVLWDVDSIGVAGFALIGALGTAFVIYLLAWKDGITGYRFILIGIGVSEMLIALTGYIIARADLYDAREAMTWLIGSVGQAGDGELRALIVLLVLVVPATWWMERQLGVIELGDDTATALGARTNVSRLVLMAIAVVLIAVATAAAGPMAFVALVAGPVATRLLGPAGGSLLVAGLVGASMVLASDIVAQHLLPTSLPTGVITGAVGAPYLVWLLVTVNREGRGG